MKKYVNGEYLDMTEEEIQEMQENMPEIPEPQETVEELIAKIEASRREQDELMARLRSMMQSE